MKLGYREFNGFSKYTQLHQLVVKQKTLAQNNNTDSETDCYPTRSVAKGTLMLREYDGVLTDQRTVQYFPVALCSLEA